MSLERLRRLEKLAALRRLVERRREAEMSRATGRLQQVEDELAAAARVELGAKLEAQRKMLDGERVGMVLAEGLVAAAGLRRAPLLRIKRVAADAVEAARAGLVESRRAAEQAGLVVEGVRAAVRAAEERREQAESDDRFAGRRAWGLRELDRSDGIRSDMGQN